MFTVLKPFVTVSQRFLPGMVVFAEEVGSLIRAEELVQSGHLKHEPAAEPAKVDPDAPAPAAS